MKEILKRYAMAFFFLLLVVFLMVLGTWGVSIFGEKMLEDTGTQMHPIGKKVDW